MMSSLEFEGKNVEKALDKASKQLNIAKDQLEYDILSYGSSGIFGLAGTKKARIRVNLDDESPENVTKTRTFDEEIEMPTEAFDDFAATDQEFHDDNHSGGQQLFIFPKNPLDLGRSVLQRIIDTITSDASITVDEDSDRILFNVVGGNAGVLIGKRGQTLEAIQSLVEKVVNKHNDNDNRIRVRVDIEGYMKTRRVNLERLAARLAEKSKRIGKPISLGQMSGHDRRIIHLALEDDRMLEPRAGEKGI